jgi:hypothetical protein
MTVLAVVIVVVAVVLVVGIAFYAVGREVVLHERRVQPAVYEIEEAVPFIAERLPDDVTARISHADVRWILMADAEELEAATADAVAAGDIDEVVDEDGAVGRVLARLEHERPELRDTDVVAVLDARLAYLRAIGAVGEEADPPA